MKILLISSKYPPEYSGSGLRAHNTYKRLSEKFKLQYDVVASSITSNRSSEYTVDGVRVKRIANKMNKRINHRNNDHPTIRIAKRIANKLFSQCDYWSEAIPMVFHMIRNHEKYDSFHIFGNVNITAAAISYAKITRKPVMIELVKLVTNPTPYEPVLVSALFGHGFPRQAQIVCISKKLKEVCLQYGYHPGQIWCRPNPVDERRFWYERFNQHQYRNRLIGLPKSRVLLLHLAKFMPLKNQLFMIEVMEFLPDDYHLLLAGPLSDSGPLQQRDRQYFDSIMNGIWEKDLQTRVKVETGFIQNPEEYIKASDVFVFPSSREALGTPILEALACGVPVVANNIPGVFDQWIRTGVNGYLCELNHKEWANKIKKASQISDITMKKASEEILSLASTEIIDREYIQRLNNLLN